MNQTAPKLLLYISGDRMFGVSLERVDEVLPAFEMTGVPGLQRGVVGLVSLRGDILPVIRVDASATDNTVSLKAQDRFIVVRSSDRTFVLLAEQVCEIIDGDGDAEARPGYLAVNQSSIERVIMHEETMVFVLDTDRLIDDASYRSESVSTSVTEVREVHPNAVASPY